MIPLFISSVQKEFSKTRRHLHDFISGDALLRRFFEPFLFEDVPAKDRTADNLYLEQVSRSPIYLGLFGDEYGWEDELGLSPTHREFKLASELNKHRLIFVKGLDDANKHLKMKQLIRAAGDQLIRRRFTTDADLVASVYASLVDYLVDQDLIRTGPFDASFCRGAELSHLDEERVDKFLRHARKARSFPLKEGTPMLEVLTHLNLLDKNRPSHAAVLLFGHKPQRFLISSEVKCAHFHGTEVAKPIPSYQVYKGTVFDLVDQAVDFVLSKINLWVGTRKDGPQVPSQYEIPEEVISEAIVNAIAHRDYTSHGSVQVMLFSDRLEIWNPGTLPANLTLAKLRQPHGSFPSNPLLAEPLYLTKYIERMGTGTGDMIQKCRAVGLPEPEFTMSDGFKITIRRPESQVPATSPIDSDKVSGEKLDGVHDGVHHGDHDGGHDGVHHLSNLSEVALNILKFCSDVPMGTPDLLNALGYGTRTRNYRESIAKLLELGLIEMTNPASPKSKKQKYQLTIKGRNHVGK